jgi:hypothetical protein
VRWEWDEGRPKKRERTPLRRVPRFNSARAAAFRRRRARGAAEARPRRRGHENYRFAPTPSEHRHSARARASPPRDHQRTDEEARREERNEVAERLKRAEADLVPRRERNRREKRHEHAD